MSDVEFRVRLSGRQKVLQEQQKNVHAFAVGKLSVSYNPYRFGYFYDVETLEPVVAGKRALVTTKAIYVEV